MLVPSVMVESLINKRLSGQVMQVPLWAVFVADPDQHRPG